MKLSYNKEVDVLRILFSDVEIEESGEDKNGVIIDYDINGNVVGIEILNASTKIGNPSKVEFELTGT